MATLTPNKSTGSLMHNYEECCSTVRDAGSPGRINTVPDSRIMKNKKKSQKSTKDYSTKPKVVQNPLAIHHPVNRVENVRRIRSVSSHVIFPPPFFINETNKRHNEITTERVQVKYPARFHILKKKTANQRTNDLVYRDSKQIAVLDLDNRASYLGDALNSAKKAQVKFNSFVDFEKKGNTGVILPQTSYSQNTSSVTSSETLSFENLNLRHQKCHFDYLKEFDLRAEGIPEGLTKWSKDERIFSLVPEVSSSEPVILPRRKYNHVVLSVKDSKSVLQEFKENDEKDLNEMTMNVEFKNADTCPIKETAVKNRRENNKCDIWFLKDKNYALNAKKPIRIKCIDEVSNSMKDVIIYSDEFFKGILKEKSTLTTTKEMYESILEEITDYQGESLRIITDIEKYCSTSRNRRKSQGDVKHSAAKISRQSSTRVSKHATSTKKKSSNITPCTKKCHTFSNTNKTKMEVPVEEEEDVPDLSSVTFVIESANVSLTQTDGASGLGKTTSIQSMKILERENTNFKSRNKTKSRTALKRMNIESIIESSFRCYFKFFSKLGHSLKSGVTISKKNSTIWLKRCRIIYDNATKSVVENCFRTVAGLKYVLNICDYIKFLNNVARNRHMLLVEILCQMMNVGLYSELKSVTKPEPNQPDEVTLDELTAQDSVPETKPKQKTTSKKVSKHH